MKTLRFLTLAVMLIVPGAVLATPDSAAIDFVALDTTIMTQMAKHGLKGVSRCCCYVVWNRSKEHKNFSLKGYFRVRHIARENIPLKSTHRRINYEHGIE